MSYLAAVNGEERGESMVFGIEQDQMMKRMR